MTLGEAIRVAREHGTRKMTRKQLAAVIDVNEKSIQNWEDDFTVPNAKYMARILTALRITFDVLMSIISDDYARQYRAMAADANERLDTEGNREDEMQVWESARSLISQSQRA
ncbi:hypothetical protein FACS1894184_08570 [Clostridia bacterium]|nr:hypothetical protein FACS1894184_08570 [Clostridia bacterium]